MPADQVQGYLDAAASVPVLRTHVEHSCGPQPAAQGAVPANKAGGALAGRESKAAERGGTVTEPLHPHDLNRCRRPSAFDPHPQVIEQHPHLPVRRSCCKGVANSQCAALD